MREWLREIRYEEHLSCKALGKKIGKSEAYIYNLEQGTLKSKGLNVELLIQIAEAVGKDPTDVFQAEIKWLGGTE